MCSMPAQKLNLNRHQSMCQWCRGLLNHPRSHTTSKPPSAGRALPPCGGNAKSPKGTRDSLNALKTVLWSSEGALGHLCHSNPACTHLQARYPSNGESSYVPLRNIVLMAPLAYFFECRKAQKSFFFFDSCLELS